jgi:hypothetical protein
MVGVIFLIFYVDAHYEFVNLILFIEIKQYYLPLSIMVLCGLNKCANK